MGRYFPLVCQFQCGFDLVGKFFIKHHEVYRSQGGAVPFEIAEFGEAVAVESGAECHVENLQRVCCRFSRPQFQQDAEVEEQSRNRPPQDAVELLRATAGVQISLAQPKMEIHQLPPCLALEAVARNL